MYIWLFLVSGSIFGKTTYINADKLPVSKENETNFRFVRENEKYVDHWSPQWNYSVEKATLLEGLKAARNFYSGQDASNMEVLLLLGDVSSYMYHLGEVDCLESAAGFYKKASRLDPLDYRSFWFLGNLYVAANDLLNAIPCYKMAQSRLPKSEPADFWEQFANAAYLAKMPSTCLFAMDKARVILGRSCEFEKLHGANVRSKIAEVYANRSYSNKELWSYTEGSTVTFWSRPLGMKVDIEPEWELDATDFTGKSATFKMIPDVGTGIPGQEVKFNMSVTARVAAEDEDLRTYLNGLIVADSVNEDVDFPNKYPTMISYEMVDPTKDKERGGTHWYVIGVKRKQPLYPGLSLEQPLSTSDKESVDTEAKISDSFKSRFAGTIFYAVILETPEAVFPTAKRTFWDLFANRLLLE